MRLFNQTLAAAAMLLAAAALFSCQKDQEDEISMVTVDKTIETRGVETDMKSAVIDVPVKSDGEWHVTITQGTPRWLRIEGWNVVYKGDATLTLIIDENLSKVDRKAMLRITNSVGELVQAIPVTQFYNYEGEAPTNGSGQAFADKGLGTALAYDYALNLKQMVNMNPGEYQASKVHLLNNVLNFARIDDWMSRGMMQKSTYVEAPIPVSDLEAVLLDSCLTQNKHLTVAMDLGIEFGPLSVAGHGEYNSTRMESRAHVDYTIIRRAPMYNVYLSPAELSAFAVDARYNKVDYDADDAAFNMIDETILRYQKYNQRTRKTDLNFRGLTEDQEIEVSNMEAAINLRYDHAGVFSTAFNDRYNELYNAIVRRKNQGKEVNPAELEPIMEALDSEFGPFIIAGGDYGGAMFIHCEIDTMYLDGKAKFEGKVLADLAGFGNFEGSVDYLEEGYSLFRNSNTNIQILGGNANETADKMMDCIASGDATSLGNWQRYMVEWVASMYSGGDPEKPFSGEANVSKAVPISFTVTPIWTFIREAEIQKYVKDYFMEAYRARGIGNYFGIMEGSDNPGAENFMNLYKGYWDN
ncbi:MAG: hypothetical protein J5917_03570 [Bacteroidales bacterium]|nr:hypothetical protein [Bacteroidales bacterium]